MELKIRTVLLLIALLPVTSAYAAKPYPTTEQREPCREYVTSKQPLFGDVHIHTRYSLDARTQDTRTRPADAYDFARGAEIGVQPWRDGKALRSLKLKRPLDFAMVSDHAELIGEVHICENPAHEEYNSWECLAFRKLPNVAYYMFNSRAALFGTRWGFCGDKGGVCRDAASVVWQEHQQAAEDAYDRSADCQFTSFVGYEWTGVAGSAANMHRNVVFRNATVPPVPHSFVDGAGDELLWDGLDAQCVNGLKGCEVLAIPHNSNLSDGNMFKATKNDGSPIDAKYAEQRARLEPLIEVMQHKGSSECFFSPGISEDELCAFEQLPYPNFMGARSIFGSGTSKVSATTGFIREVLTDGLQQQQKLGVNPFKLGFIASTDTHISAAGGADEDRFLGHGGAGPSAADGIPKGLPDNAEYNPGGLAAVWAEENSRDAIFNALQNRETFGTSGPRIALRFFGGWDYPETLCDSPDFAEQGYAGGVPMGSDLTVPADAGDKPTFAVFAVADAGVAGDPGTPLQRMQVIKGWVDDAGKRRERVLDIAGDATNGATVDLQTCATSGAGFKNLCTVWQDDEFKSGEHAWYYARAVENPTCRWSQRICAANKVDCGDPSSIGEGLEACCAADHRPVIQERAWSSPIWYTPAAQ